MASPGVFELEPVIEPASLPAGIKVCPLYHFVFQQKKLSNKLAQVTTMELCEDNLYVGTNEGSVIKYSFPTSMTASSASKERIRDLGPVCSCSTSAGFSMFH